MKNIRLLILPLILLFGLLNINEIKSQVFEGRVIYKSSIERPTNSNIPDSIFKMMFKDAVDTNEITTYYIKKDYFKMVTEGKFTSTVLYDPLLKRNYVYMKEQPDFCMWSEVTSDNQPIPKVNRNLNDTITILDKKCYSITIDYGAISKNILYYPVGIEVNTDELKKNELGIMGYFSNFEAIPYKIIMTGNGAVHHLGYTLKEIISEKLDESVFKVPDFKQMMKSPFFQK